MCMRSQFAALRSLAWATFRTDIAMINLLHFLSWVSTCQSTWQYPHNFSNTSTEQNKRAEIPSTGITPLVEFLIQECWVRDPVQRPAFVYVAATLKRLRKRQGGVNESPVPVQPELIMASPAWSQPHRHSPSMRPSELPGTSASATESVQVTPGNKASLG